MFEFSLYAIFQNRFSIYVNVLQTLIMFRYGVHQGSVLGLVILVILVLLILFDVISGNSTEIQFSLLFRFVYIIKTVQRSKRRVLWLWLLWLRRMWLSRKHQLPSSVPRWKLCLQTQLSEKKWKMHTQK